MATTIKRCGWCGTHADYVQYHDEVWGRPVKDSRELFEKLCLDGQQAGLSWLTVLRKQESYQQAFCDFEPGRIVALPEQYKDELMQNAGIIRNRLKIESIFKNARAYLNLQQQGVEFNQYLWQFSDGQPRIFSRQHAAEVPTSDTVSDTMAKALKKAGFTFVGTTICYAFMQAVGMVNDHVVDCHCHQPVSDQMRNFTITSNP